MPFDGNGNFSPPAPQYPAIAGGVILAADWNAVVADLASGLSNAVTRDGQSPARANIPMAGYKITGLGNGVASGEALAWNQVFGGTAVFPDGTAAITQPAGNNTTKLATTAFVQATAFSSSLPNQTGQSGKYVTTDGSTASWVPLPSYIQQQTYTSFTTAGTNIAYTLTPVPALTAYTVGTKFDVVFHTQNGINPTLNISGLGPQTLARRNPDGSFTPIDNAVLRTNSRYTVTYETGYLVVENVAFTTAVTGGCELVCTSATVLTLQPRRNPFLICDGRIFRVTGQTLSNSGLVANTLYYIYAYNNAGTLTLEASTTSPSTVNDLDNWGQRFKTAANDRVLVGMARTNASSQFVNTATERFVRSWFNDPGFVSEAILATNTVFSMATFNEISTQMRISFLSWSGEHIRCEAGINTYDVAGQGHYAAIGFDSTVSVSGRRASANIPNTNYAVMLPAAHVREATEGFHYSTVIGGNGTAGSLCIAAYSGQTVQAMGSGV